MKEKIFLKFQEILESEKGYFFLKSFLYFLSFFYRFFIFLKNFLYDIKILKPKKFFPFIISIGNIVSGGTGKTPFTIYLAEILMKKGYSVAIVSRGYKSNFSKINKSVFFKGKENPYNAQDIGDEPFLMSKNIEDAYFIIGNDKKKSLEIAEKKNIQIVLLDDGFQSRYIYRNFDIVLQDFEKPFSNRNFLPRGFLRESKKSLKRADLKIFSIKRDIETISSIQSSVNESSVNESPVGELPAKLCKFKEDYLYIKFYLSNIFTLSEEKIDINYFKNIPLSIFCGIANPTSFENLLIESNIENIVYKKRLLDHSDININFLNDFNFQAKEKKAKAILITEKDAVKVKSVLNNNNLAIKNINNINNMDVFLPIYYTKLNLKVIFDSKNAVNSLLKNIARYFHEKG